MWVVYAAFRVVPVGACLLCGGGGVVGCGAGADILLGPEGTGRAGVWVVVLGGAPRRAYCFTSGRWAGVGVGVCGVWCAGLLVENCTVDASIFVVKLVRASGGCLGTRSR